jgi:hypothetical protein
MDDKIYQFETYCFSINNNSKFRKKWVLGGSNLFLNAENYGSDLGVNVTSNNELSYGEFLQDLSSEKINIHSFKLISNNSLNLKQELVLEEITMRYKGYLFIPLKKYFTDKGRKQSDIIHADVKLNLDKRHHLHGTIEGKSELNIIFYIIISESSIPKIEQEKMEIEKEIDKKYNWFQKLKNFFQKK